MWQVLAIVLCLQATAQAGVVPDGENCGHLPANVTPAEINAQHLPWVVRLGYNARSKVDYRCMGTLISHRVVLTTAHCTHPLAPSEVHITDCGPDKPCGEPRKFLVTKVVTHPGYSSVDPTHNDDIALLHLDKNVHDPTKGGSHVCLPKQTFSADSLMGTKLVVAGFNIHEKGKPFSVSPQNHTQKLSTFTATPVSHQKCSQAFEKMLQVKNSHLCAFGEGKEACVGDAAAPLHSVQGTRAVLAAILTFGPNNCANSTLPTIYTNVGAHLQWIKDNMAKL